MSGRMASAVAEAPTQMPIAVPRCRGGNVAVMIESVAGFMRAAPPPRTTRAPMRNPARGASQGGAHEDHEADHEDPPAAKQFCQLAAGQEERVKRERIARDAPLEL